MDTETLQEILPLLIIIGVLLLFVIFCIKMAFSSSKAKKKAKQNLQIKNEGLKQQGVLFYSTLTHANGLPVPEGTSCELFAYQNKYTFNANNAEFNLDKEKITNVCIKTDVEIQTQYVSSVGGAVGGAMLFGGLGAVVGGRAKKKKTTEITRYLIFTYQKDDEIKYSSFEVSQFQVNQANLFVDDFKKSATNKISVDL